MNKKINYPFSAILGQDQMKEALILNLINPDIKGVLIRGQKGTGKTTAVRSLAELDNDIKVVELPINATLDRVVGTLDLETALKAGKKKFEPGILSLADQNILYVDEINLLEDHVVDALLDAGATGINTVEREGISYSHSAKFILVGTMNPEEGSLRPQLLDRFGVVVDVHGEHDLGTRVKIIEHRLSFQEDPQKFRKRFYRKQKTLRERILAAKELLPSVVISKEMYFLVAEICVAYETEGHRADITMITTAKTIAALEGDKKVNENHIKKAALLTLPHRMRKNPLEDGQMAPNILEEILDRHNNSKKESSSSEDKEGD